MLETRQSRGKFVITIIGLPVLTAWIYAVLWAWEAKDTRGRMGIPTEDAVTAEFILDFTALMIAACVVSAIITEVVFWVNRGAER